MNLIDIIKNEITKQVRDENPLLEQFSKMTDEDYYKRLIKDTNDDGIKFTNEEHVNKNLMLKKIKNMITTHETTTKKNNGFKLYNRQNHSRLYLHAKELEKRLNNLSKAE